MEIIRRYKIWCKNTSQFMKLSYLKKSEWKVFPTAVIKQNHLKPEDYEIIEFVYQLVATKTHKLK